MTQEARVVKETQEARVLRVTLEARVVKVILVLLETVLQELTKKKV